MASKVRREVGAGNLGSFVLQGSSMRAAELLLHRACLFLCAFAVCSIPGPALPDLGLDMSQSYGWCI